MPSRTVPESMSCLTSSSNCAGVVYPGSNRLDSGRLRIESPTDTVGTIVSRLGVSFIDLLPPLQAAVAEGTPLYFDFDKHWTAAGHAVAARAIHEGLREHEVTAAFETPADAQAETPGAAPD